MKANSYTLTKWDYRFMEAAVLVSSWSKDPSPNGKIGCIIVDDDKNQLSGGFNGLPRGLSDSIERLSNKDIKFSMIVHAEANAIATAARNGHSLKGSIVYCTRPPCSQCAALLIQAGIKRIIYKPLTPSSDWLQNWMLSESMLLEADIVLCEMAT